MKLTFCGGAQVVTGANYLLESEGKKILIDCGLEQGGSFVEGRNFNPFPYNPAEIEAVFITHAHIDHTGLLPKLYRDGFRGKVYSTEPTREFAELLLLDSEHILTAEAERHGKAPLYETQDIEGIVKLWEGLKYHHKTTVGPFVIEFFDAGHILGSAFIRVTAEGKKVVFSGDLGNFPAPIIRPTEFIDDADYCLIESTYGGRVHESSDQRKVSLERAIEDTVRAGGVLLIPAFAMERTQDLIYQLNDLVEAGRVPRIPIYIDSPLAIKLTLVYKKYENYFNEEAREQIHDGDDILNFPGLHFTLTTEESKAINFAPAPKMVVAGSGMSHGGRILHHEIRYLSDPKNMLLIIGYQASGSMGRRVLDGAKSVRIFGEEVPVRCQVRSATAFSAHADQPRLLAWLEPMKAKLKKVFIVQGEEDQAKALETKVREELKLEATVPKMGDTVEL
ncbi:MAG: MBL fold metallo-hydrolase [Patescibacteria group bacterium]